MAFQISGSMTSARTLGLSQEEPRSLARPLPVQA
jgi:hypothetical protein